MTCKQRVRCALGTLVVLLTQVLTAFFEDAEDSQCRWYYFARAVLYVVAVTVYGYDMRGRYNNSREYI